MTLKIMKILCHSKCFISILVLNLYAIVDVCAYRFILLQNAKTCAKKALRKVPIIGWGWVFAEMIFLERSWEKDKLILGTKLQSLVEYEDPIMVSVSQTMKKWVDEMLCRSILIDKCAN